MKAGQSCFKVYLCSGRKMEPGPELDEEAAGVGDHELKICEFYHLCTCHKASLVSIARVFLPTHLWVRELKAKQHSTAISLPGPNKMVEEQSLVKDLQEEDAFHREQRSVPLHVAILPPHPFPLLYPTPTASLGAPGLHFVKEPVSHENKTPGGGPIISEAQGHTTFLRMSLRKPPSGPIP